MGLRWKDVERAEAVSEGVPRGRDPGCPDLGFLCCAGGQGLRVSESCLHRWLAHDDVEQGNRPGVTASESAELRELRRRNKLLEQENEVLRRAAAYLSQANLPGSLGK